MDPTGKWKLMQSYSGTSTFSWTPTVSGNYTIEVWAKNDGSTSSYEAYQDVNFRITGAPASLSVTADKSSPVCSAF